MCNIKIYSSAPNLFGTRDQFQGRQFFHRSGGSEDGFRIIQALYTYCALHFYYYYISSTSDLQALDPGGLKNILPICKLPLMPRGRGNGNPFQYVYLPRELSMDEPGRL